MADNVASWIGLQGSGPDLTVQTQMPEQLQPFLQRIQAQAAEKKKKEEAEKASADELYGDMFKSMITVNKPMLKGRQDDIEQRTSDFLGKMMTKRKTDPNYNIGTDQDLLMEATKLRNDALRYEQEFKDYDSDITFARNNPFRTRVEPWMVELNKKTSEELSKDLSGGVYTAGGGVRETYSQFAKNSVLKGILPKTSRKVQDTNGNIRNIDVIGWSDELPGTKERAKESIEAFLAGNTDQAKGFLEIARDEVLAEKPELIKDPKMLGQETFIRASESMLEQGKEINIGTLRDDYVYSGKYGRGSGNQYVRSEGNYSFSPSGMDAAQVYKNKATNELLNNLAKIAKKNKPDLSRSEAMDEARVALKAQGFTPPNMSKIENAATISFTGTQQPVIVYGFKGTISQVLVDKGTNKIIGAVLQGVNEDNDVVQDYFDISTPGLAGHIQTKLPSLNEVYRDEMDADIAAYNVTKGVQMKGGEKRGEAPKAKPKEQGKAKAQGKAKQEVIDIKSVPVIKTKAEFDKLPKGAKWRKETDPPGVVRTKP